MAAWHRSFLAAVCRCRRRRSRSSRPSKPRHLTREALSARPLLVYRTPAQPIPPKKSGPGPVEQRLLPILSSDVDERVKKAAELRIQQERAISAVADENAQKVYDLKKAAWLKKEEQDRKFLQDRQTTQVGLGKTLADTDKTITETDKAKLELGGYPAQLVQEKLKREAEVGKAQAEAEMQREDARIKSRTGQLPRPSCTPSSTRTRPASTRPSRRRVRSNSRARRSRTVSSPAMAQTT